MDVKEVKDANSEVIVTLMADGHWHINKNCSIQESTAAMMSYLNHWSKMGWKILFLAAYLGPPTVSILLN